MLGGTGGAALGPCTGRSLWCGVDDDAHTGAEGVTGACACQSVHPRGALHAAACSLPPFTAAVGRFSGARSGVRRAFAVFPIVGPWGRVGIHAHPPHPRAGQRGPRPHPHPVHAPSTFLGLSLINPDRRGYPVDTTMDTRTPALTCAWIPVDGCGCPTPSPVGIHTPVAVGSSPTIDDPIGIPARCRDRPHDYPR